MNRQLAPGVSLEALKREAKLWRKALLASDAAAHERFECAHLEAPATPGLREVQHALAREYGFGSWAALKDHVLGIALAAKSPAERVNDFLELACLSFGDDRPVRWQRALKLLQRYPEIAQHSIHTAAASGDLGCMERLLGTNPKQATLKGGPQDWPPLLFLCYSRLPVLALAQNALAIAEILLAHGADPNSSYFISKCKFTALAGVIGAGDGVSWFARPPHPRAEELVALLFDRGATSNDDQVMYNTMIREDDDHWLRVFIERGLTAAYATDWSGPLFDYLMRWAIDKGQIRRARCLLEHGANPNGTMNDGRSYYERALLNGTGEIAVLLARHGAKVTKLEGREAFRAACMRGDRETAAALLREHPEYLDDPSLLIDAAGRDLAEVVSLLLDFGMSPDVENPDGGYRALHLTGCNNCPHAARVLLERGAEVDVKDSANNATPLGWANHTCQPEMVDVFVPYTRDVWLLAVWGRADRLKVVLESNPAALDAWPARGGILFHHLPEDVRQAEAIVELLLAHGADINWKDENQRTAVQALEARGSLDVAELLRARVVRAAGGSGSSTRST
jgi:ankyrin repeat protein